MRYDYAHTGPLWDLAWEQSMTLNGRCVGFDHRVDHLRACRYTTTRAVDVKRTPDRGASPNLGSQSWGYEVPAALT